MVRRQGAGLAQVEHPHPPLGVEGGALSEAERAAPRERDAGRVGQAELAGVRGELELPPDGAAADRLGQPQGGLVVEGDLLGAEGRQVGGHARAARERRHERDQAQALALADGLAQELQRGLVDRVAGRTGRPLARARQGGGGHLAAGADHVEVVVTVEDHHAASSGGPLEQGLQVEAAFGGGRAQDLRQAPGHRRRLSGEGRRRLLDALGQDRELLARAQREDQALGQRAQALSLGVGVAQAGGAVEHHRDGRLRGSEGRREQDREQGPLDDSPRAHRLRSRVTGISRRRSPWVARTATLPW